LDAWWAVQRAGNAGDPKAVRMVDHWAGQRAAWMAGPMAGSWDWSRAEPKDVGWAASLAALMVARRVGLTAV
jgi:hypothetical protein